MNIHQQTSISKTVYRVKAHRFANGGLLFSEVMYFLMQKLKILVCIK